MEYSKFLADSAPRVRYTLTTNYKDGAAEIQKKRIAWGSDVPIIDRATEHLRPLQTRIACVERDQLVKHFKVICLFGPVKTSNVKWTDGTPGTNCGEGYQNKNGLCSRITVEQQVVSKNQKASTPVTLDPTQEKFIVDLNEGRRQLAKHKNIANMHELTWDPQLQDATTKLTVEQAETGKNLSWRRITWKGDLVMDLKGLVAYLKENCTEDKEHKGEKFLISKSPYCHPYLTTIACAEKKTSTGNFVCLLGPGKSKNVLRNGSPGTQCIDGYKNNNDGLCSAEKVEALTTTEAPNALPGVIIIPRNEKEPTSSEAKPDEEQKKFIARVNDERRKFAKENNIGNMHELIWDPNLVPETSASENYIKSNYFFGILNGYNIKFDYSIKNAHGYGDYPKFVFFFPLQTTIACGLRKDLTNADRICLLGKKRSQIIAPGVPGSACSSGFENNDGLCSARKAQDQPTVKSTVAPPPHTDPSTTTENPTIAPPTPPSEDPAIPKNHDGGVSTGSEVKLDPTQEKFIADLNEYRRKFAFENNYSNMHELTWDQHRQTELKAETPEGVDNYRGKWRKVEFDALSWSYQDFVTSSKACIATKSNHNCAHIYPQQKTIACARGSKKFLCFFGPVITYLSLTSGMPGTNCDTGFKNNNKGLCSAEAIVTVDVPTTIQPEVSLDPPQAEFIAKLNQERRKFAKNYNIGNMHELIWTSDVQKVVYGLKLDKDENLKKNPDWHFLVLSNFVKGFNQLQSGDQCYEINQGHFRSLRANCEHFYPLLTNIACASKSQGKQSVMCIIGRKKDNPHLSRAAMPGSDCQTSFVNNDGLCSLNAPATTEMPTSSKPLNSETTTSSEPSKVIPAAEQVKFIEELNEERRNFAMENNCSNMHELSWSEELDKTTVTNPGNWTFSATFPEYNQLLGYLKRALKSSDDTAVKYTNQFFNPLQTEIACGIFNRKSNPVQFVCLLGSQNKPQNCITGTPGSNCLPGFKIENYLCSRNAPTVPLSSTIPPDSQTNFPMIYRTLETQTLPKELRDYDEKDGDEYDDDFPTATPVKKSSKSFEEFAVFVVFVVMVLIV